MKFFDIDRFKEILAHADPQQGRQPADRVRGVLGNIHGAAVPAGRRRRVQGDAEPADGRVCFQLGDDLVPEHVQAIQRLQQGTLLGNEHQGREILKEKVPEVDIVSPQCFSWSRGEATYEDKSSRCNVKGLKGDFAKIETPTIVYGRYINEMDVAQKRKVCVIGKQVYENLYRKGS